MTTPPWSIYASQLWKHGFGHPLWIPEPNEREVEVGDVGWLSEGEFRPLFNSRKPGDDPMNLGKVPDNYTRFDPPHLSVITGAPIMQEMICSDSIRKMDVQGNVDASTSVSPVTVGAGIRFESTTNSGALVLLQPPAQTMKIESKLHIGKYMLAHHKSWFDLANTTRGLGLKEEDIVFVCGTTKTTRWAVAAFQGETFRKKEGFVSADFASFANVNFSINIASQVLPASYYRHGPPPPQTIGPAPTGALTYPGHASSIPPSAPNQCLFVNYFKMKRRILLWRVAMRAAGGPHQLPPGPDNPGTDAPIVADAMYDVVSEQELEDGQEGYDPVNVLLDYILEQSVEAEVAIASSLDLYAIFMDREFPSEYNMHGALQEASPIIEVDERGVGMISVDSRTARKRRKDSLPIESEPKRAREMDDFDAGPSYATQSPQDEDAAMWEPEPELPVTRTQSGGSDSRGGDNDAPSGDESAGKRPDRGGYASVHDGSVTALVYSTDGRFVASGSEDHHVIIWDVRGDNAPQRLEGHEDTVSALAFSSDSRVLASASHDEHLILWNVETGEKLQDIVEAPGVSFHSLAYTPDGSKLVAGSSEGPLYVFNCTTYGLEKTIEKNIGVVTFIVFSKDGRRMATGGTESVCYIWETAQLDAESPEMLSVLDGHDGIVCAADFSPDGERIITACDDGSSRIWKAETGEALVILHEHTGPVWSVAFSHDGKHIVSGSSDSTVKVCDSYTGERVLSLDGHDSMINAVEFSSDGQFIASASSDNTVRLWRASDGECMRTFNEHNDNVTSAMFSPDGLMLASGSHDGTVKIRPVSGPY